MKAREVALRRNLTCAGIAKRKSNDEPARFTVPAAMARARIPLACLALLITAALGVDALAAETHIYTGGTDQPVQGEVRIVLAGKTPRRITVPWVAKCQHSGKVSSRTMVREFNHVSSDGFQERFRGRVRAGKLRGKVVYTVIGKRTKPNIIEGSFRLAGRYQRSHRSLGRCATGRVDWVARGPAD
jgi:hypothetical protein